MMTNYFPWPTSSVPQISGIRFNFPLMAPDDPRNERYLKVCYVCQEEAKGGQEHLRNYGGIVCYSCRAFWRRSHQKTRNPNFICKKGGQCLVSVKTRRRCQKCRYERCLMTGMNPEAVLDESQKKIRFRKLLLKRQKVGSDNPGDIVEDEDANSDLDDDCDIDVETVAPAKNNHFAPPPAQMMRAPEPTEFFHASYQKMPPLIKLQPLAPPPLLTFVKEPILAPQDLTMSEDKVKENTDALLPQIKTIVRTYQLALAQTKCSKSDELFAKLNAIQMGEIGIAVSKEDVLFLISKMSEVFRHFALLQRQFIGLEKSCQRQLLSRNTSILVQLFMGCYLLAQGSHIPHESKMNRRLNKKVWMNNFLQKQHLEKFNTITNLFQPDADLDQYARLINNLKGLPALVSIEQKAILSFIILFGHDQGMAVSSDLKNVAASNETMYNNNIKTCDDCLDLSDLADTLVEMAEFCSKNIHWTTQERQVVGFDRKVPTFSMFNNIYTMEEEYWIKLQFQRVDEAFRSVAVGDQMIREYIACSTGLSPVPAHHMPNLCKILEERILRVAKIHPEFELLPSEKQRSLMSANCVKALALCLLKAGTCRTGLEQIQDGLGELDEKKWNEEYLPSIGNLNHLEKITLRSDPTIPETVLRQHIALLESSAILTSNPQLYKLNLLMVLTKQDNPWKDPGLEMAYNRYVTVLKRRIGWICQQNSSFGDANEIIDEVFSSLENLPKIAYNLAFIMPKPT